MVIITFFRLSLHTDAPVGKFIKGECAALKVSHVEVGSGFVCLHVFVGLCYKSGYSNFDIRPTIR